MKKYLLLVLLLLFPFSVFGLELDTYSSNVIIYNLNDDSVLYEKSSEEVVSIASLTKIMTSIVALEKIKDLDEKVVLVNSDFYGLAEANASTAGFYSGEEVTYRDLLFGLLLPSGADAAQALSRLVAGSVENYVSLMNQKVEELGLSNTHFMNTTGLDEERHYSTVLDVSKIFKYALSNEDFVSIIKEKYYTTSNGRHKFKNTITKMQDLYNVGGMDYLIGGKTGTTGDAGLCLATVAEKDNVKYMLVTVRAPFSREAPYNLLDAKNIYEYFMNNYSYQNVLDENDKIVTIKTEYVKEDNITFEANKNVDLYLENDFNKNNVVYKYKGVNLIKHDMRKGDKLGVVDVIYNDKVLTRVDVVLDRNVEFDLVKYIKGHKIFSYIFYTLCIVMISFIVVFSRKRKKLKKL